MGCSVTGVRKCGDSDEPGCTGCKGKECCLGDCEGYG